MKNIDYIKENHFKGVINQKLLCFSPLAACSFLCLLCIFSQEPLLKNTPFSFPLIIVG